MNYAEIIFNDWGDNLFGFMYIKGEDIENGDDISYLAFGLFIIELRIYI